MCWIGRVCWVVKTKGEIGVVILFSYLSSSASPRHEVIEIIKVDYETKSKCVVAILKFISR